MVVWCGAALIEILFQSQSEGRLLEEPFLYLLFAIVAALEMGAGTRGHDPIVEPAADAAPEAAVRTEQAGAKRRAPVPAAGKP